MPERNDNAPEVDDDSQEVPTESPFKPSPTLLDGDGGLAKKEMRRVLGLPDDEEDKEE